MSTPQEVLTNTSLGRKFFHAGRGDPISSTESEESDNMSATSPVGLNNTPKRKNTLRKKVSKLKQSTQSLFRRTPKGDSDSIEVPLKPNVIADELVKHPDAQPIVSDNADAQGLPCEVFDNAVTECPTMALLVPLPESGSEELLLPSPTNNVSTADGHSDPKSSRPEVTRTCIAELAEVSRTEPMKLTEPELELTRDALGTSTGNVNAPNVVTETKPPSTLPISAAISTYVFGRFTYYQVTAITLAAIGLCVVAAPQTYRLFRLR